MSSLSEEQQKHLFDLAEGLDAVCCLLKVYKYSCNDATSHTEVKDFVIFCQDLQKSLDCLTSYMDVLLFDLYEMCGY